MSKAILKKVIDAILESSEETHRKVFKQVIESTSLTLGDVKDYDDFYYKFIYPYDNFMDSLIQETISKNQDVRFIFTHSDFFEAHYLTIIEQAEGVVYCADKSSTILRALINFFITSKEIEFDYTQEYTFHLPKKKYSRLMLTLLDSIGHLKTYILGNQQSMFLR
jgi:hypothetical protein